MNPRAAINDLLPFQGSPFGQLGYFSKCPIFFLLFASNIRYYIRLFYLCQAFFLFFSLNKRRGWDSNPRALADKRFSRPPRYDHFDTSPRLTIYHLFALSVSAQVTFYHHLQAMSIHFFFFLQKIYISLFISQKSFCNRQIFRGCNLYILITPL